MPTSRRTTAAGAVAALVAVACVVALALSCSGDDEDDPPPTTTTAEPTSTTQSVESEVEAAYVAYREMVTRLLQAPDPDDPEIAQRATGETREQLVAGLAALQQQNQAIRFGEDYGYDVLDVRLVDEVSATLTACLIDDAQTVDVQTGEVVNEGISTGRITVSLERVEDSWLVSLTPEPEFVDEGAASCT